jgi:hypothetical protein
MCSIVILFDRLRLSSNDDGDSVKQTSNDVLVVLIFFRWLEKQIPSGWFPLDWFVWSNSHTTIDKKMETKLLRKSCQLFYVSYKREMTSPDRV